MANTFGAIPFHQEQQDGLSVAIWPSEQVTAVDHVPGSDTDVVQHLGRRGAVEVTLPVIVREANWSAFLALRGQTAALALIGNGSRQATLTKVANARWFEAEAFYRCQATWLG